MLRIWWPEISEEIIKAIVSECNFKRVNLILFYDFSRSSQIQLIAFYFWFTRYSRISKRANLYTFFFKHLISDNVNLGSSTINLGIWNWNMHRISNYISWKHLNSVESIDWVQNKVNSFFFFFEVKMAETYASTKGPG